LTVSFAFQVWIARTSSGASRPEGAAIIGSARVSHVACATLSVFCAVSKADAQRSGISRIDRRLTGWLFGGKLVFEKASINRALHAPPRGCGSACIV
jgi:hypothetical protein